MTTKRQPKRKKRGQINKIQESEKRELAKMKNCVKRVKSEQLRHMNVVAKLVKEVETLISDRFDFSKKTISRVRATWKKLIDSRVAIEKLDEALAEEGDSEDEEVTVKIEQYQEVLMLLKESLFNIEDFEEVVWKRKGNEVLGEQQGAAVNVVSETCDQEQQNVAIEERVNVSAENFISSRLSDTERAFTEDSVDAAVAEVQAGWRIIVFSVDEEHCN